MSETTILFPHLGITLPNVGQSVRLFGFEIAYYGIIIGIGMILGVSLIQWLAKRSGQDDEMYFDMCLITLLCAVVGARLYYVAFSWEDYAANPLEIFNIRGGGLAIYGGVLAGILTVWIFSRVKKQNFGLLGDTVAPGLLVGQILGRWGNFFNREAFGGYTDQLLAMALPRYAVRQDEITEQMLEHIQVLDGIEFIQVHPTFLYESLWNIGVLLFLLWYLKRKKFHGEVFLLYLTGYGLGRVWIEGLRTDQLLIPGIGLPVSQVLSAVLVIGSLITIMIKRRERNARENDNRKIKNTD